MERLCTTPSTFFHSSSSSSSSSSSYGPNSVRGYGHGLRPCTRLRRRPSPCPARASLEEEEKNPVALFLKKVQGSLPVVGLLSRIFSDEGGIGTDRLQLVEFCRRIENRSSLQVSQAYALFAERHGKVAKPTFVLIWCWAAAVGAGLLKNEDFVLGAARLRVSNDIQFEVETFNLLMDDALEKRAKARSPTPEVPVEACAQKALDAICICCLGERIMDEEDARLLSIILSSAFPTLEKSQSERILRAKSAEAVDDQPGQNFDESMPASGVDSFV